LDADASRRRDLRHLTTYAVDDAGTSEVDDAVSWEELPWGGTKLWVHVADPTRWLAIGRAFGSMARGRDMFGSLSDWLLEVALALVIPTGVVSMYALLVVQPLYMRQLWQGLIGHCSSGRM
jgi:hypothetical protein